jgi:predicted O-methyltransferase YrrM/D-alanine-D-alanine ligase-like ATP-grasp enzyme
MLRICLIASHFTEAGIIDESRLLRCVERIKEQGLEVECLFDPSQWEIEKNLARGEFDFYLPLTMHSFEAGETGPQPRRFVVQATLERHNARFVGSSALVQMLVRDKAVVTRQSGIGLETRILSRRQIEHGLFPEGAELSRGIVIVKPNDMTSSIGIDRDSVVEAGEALKRASRLVRDHPLVEDVLIQPYVAEGREFTVSLLGNVPRPLCSVLELRSRSSARGHGVFTGEMKNQTSALRDIEAVICRDEDIRQSLAFHSTRLFDWFNMKDYARFDYIYTDRPYLIDVNAMPVLGRSFGMELAERFRLDLDNLGPLLLIAAAARYTTSGRPTPLPNALVHGFPAELREAVAVSLPVEAVPESTQPSAFQPLTGKFTMVDRVGAETETLYFLKALVGLTKPRFVLETGTYRGATAAAIGEALRSVGEGRLVTLECDPHYASHARRSLCGLPVEVVWGSSLDHVPAEPIDLLFLDSTRPARIHEFRRFKPYLSDRALIVWHDSAPEHKVVHGDIASLVAEGEIHAVLIPSPRGLTVSKVRGPSPL